MSTKPIREALEKMFDVVDARVMHSGDRHDVGEAYDAALEAVRAIEEMARTLTQDEDCTPLHHENRKKEAALLESIAKEAP